MIHDCASVLKASEVDIKVCGATQSLQSYMELLPNELQFCTEHIKIDTPVNGDDRE